MKFGIFYELQLPKPWGPNDELNLYQNALNQVELADKLGYDYAWEVEHHFLDEYSHSPQPEVFLAAASQRTKRIRMGHGIIQLTTNHPARVAEKVACLDLVSNGRVEFGMGEAGSVQELAPFGIDMAKKREIWEDAVKCIIPMFTKEGWQYDGPYFKFPLRNVTPKPVQKPHPPLWVACSQLETIEMAGRRGIGALGFQFLTSEMAHAWVRAAAPTASRSFSSRWPTTPVHATASGRPRAPSPCGTSTTSGRRKIRKRTSVRCAAA